jgi:hypothetical protein
MQDIEGFEPVLRELATEWDPEVPPIVTSLSAIGRHVAERSDAYSEDDLRTIFGRIELMLVSGSELEKDAAATGFLEAVASVLDEAPGRRSILRFMGPVSREYLRSWDAFCGIGSDQS